MAQAELRTLEEADENGRPSHGALVFPELIWDHYCWQHALHPERYPGSNGQKNGNVRLLEKTYHRTLERFEHDAGEVVDAYWCQTDASAVVLTRKQVSRWPKRHDLRLYRASDWVTSAAPRIAALLHHSDTIAMKANQILPMVPKRITLNWIFNEQSFLLGVIERSGGKVSDEDLDAVVAEHAEEIKRIERYYDGAANKTARLVYFLGMLVGILLLATVGLAISAVLGVFSEQELRSTETQNFFAAYGAGAVGALVSVMLRMRPDTRRGFSVDYEVGRGPLFWLGAFRPFIGAIFASVLYFALESDFVSLGTLSQQDTFTFYAFVGFLAGFSERFTHVIFGQAELTVASALDNVPPGRDEETERAETEEGDEVDEQPRSRHSPQRQPVDDPDEAVDDQDEAVDNPDEET